jgi:hypothetical protein
MLFLGELIGIFGFLEDLRNKPHEPPLMKKSLFVIGYSLFGGSHEKEEEKRRQKIFLTDEKGCDNFISAHGHV